MTKFCLTKNDDEDISFAIAAFSIGVISFDEFKDWIYYVIEHTEDEIPAYLFELLDTKSKVDFKPFRAIPWCGGWPGDTEARALEGLAFMRNEKHSSDFVSKGTALKALEANPQIKQRVREAFPFIDFYANLD